MREQAIGIINDALPDGETKPLGAGWRGWDFWRVVTIGGISPIIVRRTWTVIDVWEYSYQLQIRSLFDSLG